VKQDKETKQERRARLKELTEARDKVERQIDLLLIGNPLCVGRNRDVQVGGLIEELSDTLRELRECIAELEADDTEGPSMRSAPLA
jgi:hypothetical protein